MTFSSSQSNIQAKVLLIDKNLQSTLFLASISAVWDCYVFSAGFLFKKRNVKTVKISLSRMLAYITMQDLILKKIFAVACDFESLSITVFFFKFYIHVRSV
jgi:hypothetical protein